MKTNQDFKRELIGKAFNLSRKIISLVDKLPNKKSVWIVSDQLLRSATSVGANIIEAQAASSTKDFMNFLNHALKSGNETKFWLALARGFGKENIQEINGYLKEVDELTKILGSSIATMKGKRRL